MLPQREELQRLLKKANQHAVDEKNFAIETTLSGSFVLRHMKIAKEKGYKVVIIDNTGEPEVVAEIKHSQISFCQDEIPTWARGALELYL